jgi:hypothetical protein
MPMPKWMKKPSIYGETLNGKTEPKAAMISMGGMPMIGRAYMIMVITAVARIPALTAPIESICMDMINPPFHP